MIKPLLSIFRSPSPATVAPATGWPLAWRNAHGLVDQPGAGGRFVVRGDIWLSNRAQLIRGHAA
ncbi:MAG: hypothetical protein ACKV2V_19370, partial [Blastocatellia bacterium]